jgi:predicted nucleic acid-binding protein
MNGVKYLLDTNFVIGLLKAAPEVVTIANQHVILAAECAYSAITRMELLGYPGINSDEESLISQKLANFRHLGISPEIEDRVIGLRRTRRIKLPDAIIAATVIHHQLRLLTLDQQLQAVVTEARPGP